MYVNSKIIKLLDVFEIYGVEGIDLYTGAEEDINFRCGGIFRWQDRDHPSYLSRMELDSALGNLWIDGNFWANENLYINWGNADVDAILYFGKPTSGTETLRWSSGSERFELSNDLRVDGDVYADSENRKGVIVKDPSDGISYRITVVSGSVVAEAV